MTTAFFRLLAEDDKEQTLADAVEAANTGQRPKHVYWVDPGSFRQVPGTPFVYWVSDRTRKLFSTLPPFEDGVRTVRQGLGTADDFRFVRCWWEIVPCKQDKNPLWVNYAKGGGWAPFYSDVNLVVRWKDNAKEMWFNLTDKGTIRSNIWMLNETISIYFFSPGLTFPSRPHRKGSFAVLPRGCAFSVSGMCVFDKHENLLALASLLNSSTYIGLLSLLMARGSSGGQTLKYEKGYITAVPIPRIDSSRRNILSDMAMKAWSQRYILSTYCEQSLAFLVAPAVIKGESDLRDAIRNWEHLIYETRREYEEIQKSVDEHVAHLYSIDEKDREIIQGKSDDVGIDVKEGREESIAEKNGKNELGVNHRTVAVNVLSWCVGAAMGRWDVRITLDPSLAPKLPDPFDPLPVCPPGMLVGPDGLPAKPGGVVSEEWLRARPDANTLPLDGSVSKPTIPDSEYPLRINWDGILVDDPGFNGGQPHRDDIVRRVREVFDLLWKDKAYEIEQEACGILGVRDLRDYFRKPSGFFQDHLKRYSKSRRKAPIYWPLSTASGSYTIWLYYHRLTDQTLYAAVNKYLEPKIADTERALDRLEVELAGASGREATRLRDRLNEGRAFLGELQDLREELLRVAGLPYKPDLNDGVIINAAPLHRLFRLRSWAKETEEVWRKLEKGDYDWAHMAYTIWPDRVREVCRRDRSIAIAHGLEAICEVEAPAPKKKGGRGRRKRGTAG